jgi:ADP-heptose:LPS heptosyltransferase
MTSNAATFPKEPPRNILLLKGHSAGIGDLLRSSAAWRALHDHFPGTRLHLWFLTKDPGAASEKLIAQHHLLTSFWVSDKRTKDGAGRQRLLQAGRTIVAETKPELIIDFEPNGFRTTLLAWRLGRWARAATLGIAQVPVRGWFYTRSAPPVRAYAQQHEYSVPLEYTERDFVALAPLGIERDGTAIELQETEEARAFRKQLRAQMGGDKGPPLLGLNIGCGTPDALVKRPDLKLLLHLVRELQLRHNFRLVLTGASFEQDVNEQFRMLFGRGDDVVDLAGQTSLVELIGAIAACRLFISSDSGPYHMAVGLRVPTLAVFAHPNPLHYHRHPWVECHVAPDARAWPTLVEAAERLLKVAPPPTVA